MAGCTGIAGGASLVLLGYASLVGRLGPVSEPRREGGR
jgi:hypothetical protein